MYFLGIKKPRRGDGHGTPSFYCQKSPNIYNILYKYLFSVGILSSLEVVPHPGRQFWQHLEEPATGPPPQILSKYMFWSEMTATDVLIPAFCTESQDGPVGTGPGPKKQQKQNKKIPYIPYICGEAIEPKGCRQVPHRALLEVGELRSIQKCMAYLWHSIVAYL